MYNFRLHFETGHLIKLVLKIFFRLPTDCSRFQQCRIEVPAYIHKMGLEWKNSQKCTYRIFLLWSSDRTSSAKLKD